MNGFYSDPYGYRVRGQWAIHIEHSSYVRTKILLKCPSGSAQANLNRSDFLHIANWLYTWHTVWYRYIDMPPNIWVHSFCHFICSLVCPSIRSLTLLKVLCQTFSNCSYFCNHLLDSFHIWFMIALSITFNVSYLSSGSGPWVGPGVNN